MFWPGSMNKMAMHGRPAWKNSGGPQVLLVVTACLVLTGSGMSNDIVLVSGPMMPTRHADEELLLIIRATH